MGSRERVAVLIGSLEQATIMAKQIGVATMDQTQLVQIYSSLHHAHQHLSAFLFSGPAAASSAGNCLSSGTGLPEPMQLGEEENGGEAVAEEEEEENSAIVKVEERMRDCFTKNKRPKRPLSPSAAAAATSVTAAEERRVREYGSEFDKHETKLRALDLVYQFHG